MKSIRSGVLSVSLALCSVQLALAQAPSIRTSEGVLSAASYAYSGLPNGGVAQGSMFAVFGDNLGPATLVEVNAFPLPTSAGLAGTTVQVTVNGTTVYAIMIYTLKTQVAAVLPSNTPVGNGTLTVTYNGQPSNAVPIHVVSKAFGVFAANQGGSGPGAIQNFNSDGSLTANALNHAAHPGQVVIIWGTGIGPVSGDETASPLPGDMTNLNIHAYVGFKEAAIQYRGRSGCCVGDDQVVITVPDGIEGCYIPVYLTVDNVISNFVSMSVSSSGDVCTDANGYAANEWAQLLQQPDVKLGALVVGRIFNRNMASTGFNPGGAPYRDDGIEAVYENWASSNYLYATGQPPVGACVVTQIPGGATPSFSFLDAGNMTVDGPVGHHAVPKASTGVYQLVFFPSSPGPAPNIITDGTLVTAGTYTLNVTAGTQVGAHTVTFNHPASFTWTDFSSFSGVIDRSQPLTISWTGATPGALVNIYGQSAYAAGPLGDYGAAFQCTGDAGAGSFTIPAAVLSALPATYTDNQGTPRGHIVVEQYLFDDPEPVIPGIDLTAASVLDDYNVFATTYH